MKPQAGMAGTTTGRMTVENESRTQLRRLSRELREVHRGLMEVSRDAHEAENGPVCGRAELLDLLLQDERFAWLGPLSRLIVEVDELVARDPVATEAETAAMGARVQAFVSSSDDPDAFGSRYVDLLVSEPRVAMVHVGLRAVLDRYRSRGRMTPRGGPVNWPLVDETSASRSP